MLIYLVRHGDALSAVENPARPLSRAGRASVERVARLALERAVHVSAIYHSGILRAEQTAAILAEHLAPPLGVQPRAGLLPEDDPAIVKTKLDVEVGTIMLVGHLPHMNRLAGLLITGDPDRTVVEFSPPTMVCCVNDGGKWKFAWKLV